MICRAALWRADERELTFRQHPLTRLLWRNRPKDAPTGIILVGVFSWHETFDSALFLVLNDLR